MRGRNRKSKGTNRFYRWMAIALTVALLSGQGNAFALAQEEALNAPTAGSSEEIRIDAPDSADTEDDNDADGRTGGVDGADNENAGDDKEETGADDENTGNRNDENGAEEGTDGQIQCICGTRCTADNVNADCPVCGADYTVCACRTGDDTENKDTADDAEGDTENNDDKEDAEENTDGQNQCVCGTRCTADSMNADCPVCGADYSLCGGAASAAIPEGIILENDLPEEEGAAMSAEDGVEAHFMDTFMYDGYKYMVVDDGAEICAQTVSGDLVIPDTVQYGSKTYPVTGIGVGAFKNSTGLTSITIPDTVTRISNEAFRGCSGLTRIELPDQVTEINSYTFYDCVNLEQITIPKGLKLIYPDAFSNCRKLSGIELPEGLEKIGNAAFTNCASLGSATGGTVIIPDSVINMGTSVFWGCTGLTSMTLPGDIIYVNSHMFHGCKNLREVKFRPSVNYDFQSISSCAFIGCSSLDRIELPDSTERIYDGAFSGCSSLRSIKLPDKVQTIEWETFNGCSNLQWIEFSDRVTTIGTKAFYGCAALAEMRIVVSADGKPTPPTVNKEAFSGVTDERFIVFADGSGNELTGQSYEEARDSYLEAGKSDDDPEDGKWYGWTIKGSSGTVDTDTYQVTVRVKKDGQEWSGHGRRFALLPEGGGFITDLVRVPNGSYRIYDITGVSADSLYSGARDTGVDVRVNGVDTEVSVTVADGPAEAEIRYYTVTFYDGADAYGAGTPQEPQIVLQNKKAARPADPSKTDYQFAGWKTADGVVPYDFESAVTDATGIYASWIERAAKQLHIAASAEEGGTISPAGDISVTEGGELTFTITPNEGNRIKAVTVDGRDVTGELADNVAKAQTGAKYYTFTNITENHTILASFESSGSTPGGDDNPNPGDGSGTGGSTPGGGDSSNPGGGSGTGGSSNSSGSDNSGGGNGTGGDSNQNRGNSAGNVQVTAISETASAPAGNGAADNTGTAKTSAGQESGTGSTAAPDSEAAAAGVSAGASGQAADKTEPAAGGTEPKTGDTAYIEIYATMAMIAGLTYLLLCFMEEGRGMTEREKDVFVAAFIRWGKKGGAFRKACAVVAIFCLLMYYHAIGKRVGKNVLNDKYLGMAS